MSGQYLRKASLVVADGESGIELSALRFTWKIRQWDISTPNSGSFRIYNVSEETANKVQEEFSRVILQAGYEDGNYGTVFDGTIVQVRKGRENATDTYLDILAADGDKAYNFAIANYSLAGGSTPDNRLKALVGSMADQGVTEGYTPEELPGNALPRGKVVFGMVRDHLDTLANSTETSWSIQNGEVQVVPIKKYLPGEAVVLTSLTGMIGLPEQTQNGIKVRCLLNPSLKVNGRIQIDNKSIQRAEIDLQYTAINYLPRVTDDGFYRIIVLDMIGDSRGNDWYSDIIAIALDDGVTPGLVAKGYG